LHRRQALPRDFLQNRFNDGSGDGKFVHITADQVSSRDTG
jgi:hypothetical protein